jgi:hypothetical protein
MKDIEEIRKKWPHGRPVRVAREYLKRDTEPSVDPVFCRLIQDLQLARRTIEQIEMGDLPECNRAAAHDLERGAFQHLFNYLSARAWVRTNDRDA